MCLAIPGKIVSTSGDDPLTRVARVSFGGVVKEVSLAYVPEAKVDDYVIVHAGFALSQIDEEEAQRVFEELARLGAMSDEEEAGAVGPAGRAGPDVDREEAS
jgi:hydrogenase expression/formation protein HypC